MMKLLFLAGAVLVSSLKMQSTSTDFCAESAAWNWVCMGAQFWNRPSDWLYINSATHAGDESGILGRKFASDDNCPTRNGHCGWGSNYGLVVSPCDTNGLDAFNTFYGTSFTCCNDNYHICGCNDAQLANLKDGNCQSAKAGGDPHLLNIKGERFNINRIGYAPLVSIISDGAPHLEVMALIEGVKKCQKKMFITHVNSSGSWLEKSVAVKVQNQGDDKAFSVMVDGQEVWSPASQGYQPSTTENVVFHTDRFSINEMLAKATSANQPGIELKMAHDVKMKIMRPLHRPTAPPHLNFDIQGLRNLPLSFKLGGLLGQDDHSYWSTRDADCAANFVKQAAEVTEGSQASAN